MKQVLFKDVNGRIIFTHDVDSGGFALSVEKAFTAFFKDTSLGFTKVEKYAVVHTVEVNRK